MTVVEKILKRRGGTGQEPGFLKVERLNFPELDEAVEVVLEQYIYDDYAGVAAVLYDPDVDGLFSGYTLEDVLTRAGKKVKRYINTEKQHGIVQETMDWVLENDIEWLFVVDAGSNDYKNIKKLVNAGVRVVVIDHHPYEEKKLPEGAWIVNISKYPELPKLPGCGVVYRFVEALGAELGLHVKQYETFVGITVMSDMCAMDDEENRYYVKQAYKGYRDNLFLRQFKYYGSHRSFYGWQVSPYLNAMIRVGEEDRAVEIVNNMTRRLKMNEVERDVKRVKRKQEEMKAELRERGDFRERKSFFVHLRKGRDHLGTLNGLVANEYVGLTGKGGLVLAYDRDMKMWVGSYRGVHFTREVLEEWGFWTAGHPTACGVKVSNKDLKNFYKNFKYPIKGDAGKADIYVNAGELSSDDWQDIAIYNEYSGIGNPEIVVGYKKGIDEVVSEDESFGIRSLYTKDGEIKEFNRSADQELKVVPILNGDGYQFIRA